MPVVSSLPPSRTLALGDGHVADVVPRRMLPPPSNPPRVADTEHHAAEGGQFENSARGLHTPSLIERTKAGRLQAARLRRCAGSTRRERLLRSRRLRRALAEGLASRLAAAERPEEHEDPEADAGEEERDAGDDPEQRHVLREVARVERGRQCGLGHPRVPGRVVDRLPVRPLRGLARVVGALAVGRRVARHLRVGQATARLERVDPHVLGEVAGEGARRDRLAGDVRRRQLDRGGQARRLGLGRDPGLGHVGRADDLLCLEAVADRVAAVDAQCDGDGAEQDQHDRCNDASDLQVLAHL